MSLINSSVFQGGDAGRAAASQIASQVKSSASGMSPADVAALAGALAEASKGTAAAREGACMAVEAIASTARAAAEVGLVFFFFLLLLLFSLSLSQVEIQLT
jgi:hypothetical protein